MEEVEFANPVRFANSVHEDEASSMEVTTPTRQGSLRFEDSACSPVFEGADERARGPAGKKKGGGEGPKLSEVEVEPEVDGSGSVVMFVQPKFTADEAAGRVRCSVIRIGATDCRATVKFSTCDGSAGAGDDYVAVENEELVFAPGQTTAEAEVTIVGNDRWEEVETFVVRLSQPRGTRLGPLSEATVSVADDDEYPTGEHSEGWALLRGFIIEQVAQRGKKFWQTVCALVYIGLFPTIDALILKLVIDNSLKSARATQGGSGSGVDVDADNTAGHNTVAIVLGAVYMLCLGLYHKCDVVQLDKRGRSGTRKWLRNVLVVRFLNMSETGRRGLSDGDFLNCVYFQVEQLVCDGWYSFLLFFQFGTQIVSGMVFQVLLLALTTQVPFWPLLLGLLVVSALVGFTLAYRQMTQLELERIRGEAEDEWVGTVNEVVENRPAIQSYEQVQTTAQHFSKQYTDFYDKHRASRFYQKTSQWIPTWMMASVLFVLYSAAPTLVRVFEVSAGDFAAVVKSWLKLKSGVEGIYGCALKLQRSVVALEKVADVLNRTTIHEEMLRKDGRSPREVVEERVPGPTGEVSFEALDEIHIDHLTFDYEDTCEVQTPHGWTGEAQTPLLDDTSCTIPTSNHLIKLVNDLSAEKGQRRWAKRTLMRLMAKKLYPLSGSITMPPHKRVLLVDRNPVLLNGSLLENLRFGILPENEEHVCEEIAIAVAITLGMSSELASSPDRSLTEGDQKLPTRDVIAITLARMFLAEPGVILLDHLGDSLGSDFSEHILGGLLRRYVQGGLLAVVQGLDVCENVLRLQKLHHKSVGQANTVKLPPAPAFLPTVVWSSLVTTPGVGDYVLHMKDGKLRLEQP